MPSRVKRDNATSSVTLRAAIQHHARYTLAKEWEHLNNNEVMQAVSYAVRDIVIDRMLETERRISREKPKRLYYLSIEFLMGQSLRNNLVNLGLFDKCARALHGLGFDIEEVCEVERDAALGNGGLGRLAACFLDSLATLELPGYGYGIDYEFGLFRQEIRNGHQRERPDSWRSSGTAWRVRRPEECCMIPLYGHVSPGIDKDGNHNPMWLDWQILVGIPQDMPIVGYEGQVVNRLRLYAAKAPDEFNIDIFNAGDYIRAVESGVASESVTKVLYPSDSVDSGKELRLIQEYFFVACALRDILRNFLAENENLSAFPDKVAIQINDTHPALAVAELMRLLVDEKDLPWEMAWDITRRTMGYTNHTLLPEALEKWPVQLLEKVIPRHLQIIYEINHRFLEKVAQRWPGDSRRLRELSLIEEGDRKHVRMAHLAIVGSHSINGVAELHTKLLRANVVPGFNELWPKRFNNKTNGISQRRWLLGANPGLSALVSEVVGDGWIRNLEELRGLEKVAEDASFQQAFRAVKLKKKEDLALAIARTVNLKVDPASVFDCHAKRIHEYKRQLLNVLNIVYQYVRIVEDSRHLEAPKTHVFAGKAAPGYWTAKQIIRLIHAVGAVINKDPRTRGQLRVVFMPDYRVSLAERLIPAADLSEQISTAGMEASGTGNMKFALNGALTIGTMDGANVEIRDEVGAENIFIFGLKADDVERLHRERCYSPWNVYNSSSVVRRVIDALKSDLFRPHCPDVFDWVVKYLLEYGDHYLHLADLESYVSAQDIALEEYCRTEVWTRKAILNVARIGKFSSDRTIREYCRDIWGLGK